MAKTKPLRLAPAQDGKQAARAWRVWTQGPSFYAAPRDIARHGRVSFHPNNQWQFHYGTMSHRLARPIEISKDWLGALQLKFLLGPQRFLPTSEADQGVTLCAVPSGEKLRVDLLISKRKWPSRTRLGLPRGSELKTFRLRSGRFLLVGWETEPMIPEDLARIQETNDKLRIGMENDPGETYVEMSFQSFDPVTGNVIVIIPASPDVVDVQNRDQ